MRMSERVLRNFIKSILKENTMGLGDVEGSVKVRGLNIKYKLVDYGECELTFTVENSSGRDLLESLIKVEAKKCGQEPDMYGSSQSITFSISDMTEARKCKDQILEYFEYLNSIA